MKTIKLIWIAPMLVLAMACNSNRNDAKVGGASGADTTSSNKGGGGAITDTSTISATRNEFKRDSVKGDTTGRGNVDPSGQSAKSNH